MAVFKENDTLMFNPMLDIAYFIFKPKIFVIDMDMVAGVERKAKIATMTNIFMASSICIIFFVFQDDIMNKTVTRCVYIFICWILTLTSTLLSIKIALNLNAVEHNVALTKNRINPLIMRWIHFLPISMMILGLCFSIFPFQGLFVIEEIGLTIASFIMLVIIVKICNFLHEISSINSRV